MMSSTINYQNLSTLMNLSETISKLDGLLFHVKNNLEEELENFKTSKQLNVEQKEYVIIQELDSFIVRVGFNWQYDDVYFGIRVYVPRENGNAVVGLKNILDKYQWGYSKEEKYFVVSHERRLADCLCTNDEPELENEALLDLFLCRIKECKIIAEELRNHSLTRNA